jgi:hypothetical protein
MPSHVAQACSIDSGEKLNNCLAYYWRSSEYCRERKSSRGKNFANGREEQGPETPAGRRFEASACGYNTRGKLSLMPLIQLRKRVPIKPG